MNNNTDIGMRLKKVRKALNMTQSQFADELGLTQAAISNYERGENIPSQLLLSTICTRFNINKDYMFNGQGKILKNIDEKELILNEFCNTYNLDDTSKFIIKEFISITPETRAEIIRFLKSLITFKDNDK